MDLFLHIWFLSRLLQDWTWLSVNFRLNLASLIASAGFRGKEANQELVAGWCFYFWYWELCILALTQQQKGNLDYIYCMLPTTLCYMPSIKVRNLLTLHGCFTVADAKQTFYVLCYTRFFNPNFQTDRAELPSDLLSFDVHFAPGPDTWSISQTINNLAFV